MAHTVSYPEKQHTNNCYSRFAGSEIRDYEVLSGLKMNPAGDAVKSQERYTMKIQSMNITYTKKLMRHLIVYLRRITLRRSVNILLAVFSYIFRLSRVPCSPFLLKIEPSSFCNLRCLGCRSETGKIDFDEGIMSFADYEKILAASHKYLLEIIFYLWGEPFTNKKLPDMIELASRYNIGSVISTNLHFMSADIADSLVRSSLDKIVIAIDGLDQETYQRIRAGGNLEKVFGNLDILLAARRKQQSPYPKIEWQFIKTSFNEHQIARAQQMASEKGVDVFTIMKDLSGRDNEPSFKQEHVAANRKLLTACPWLWTSLAIQWDGSVFPCCHIAKFRKYVFSDIAKARSLKEIWNTPPFVESRKKFALINAKKQGSTRCFGCWLY